MKTDTEKKINELYSFWEYLGYVALFLAIIYFMFAIINL